MQRSNDVSDKDNNRRYNSINVRNKYQPIFTQENEVTESRINNRMDKDANKYKNVFNNNIDINVIQKKTVHKRRPTTAINRFPERER